MYDEHDLIDSPLSQSYVSNGLAVEIQIYRMPDAGWTLEVVDQHHNSTVWDGDFATDQDALDAALADLQTEGNESFIGRASNVPLH